MREGRGRPPRPCRGSAPHRCCGAFCCAGALRRVGRRTGRLRGLRRRGNGRRRLGSAAGEDEQPAHQHHADERQQHRPRNGGDHGVKVPQPAAAAVELNLPMQVGVHRTRERSTRMPDSDSLLECVGSNTERLAYKLGPPRSYHGKPIHRQGDSNIRKASSGQAVNGALQCGRAAYEAGGGAPRGCPARAAGCSSIGAGAPVIGSWPVAVFGKAITSRIDSRPASSAAIRSSPNAIPPCGGAPCLSASIRKPNFSSAASRPMPRSPARGTGPRAG